MRCWDFEQDLGEWLRGRLSAERAAAMAAHIEGCPRCQRAALLERRVYEHMSRTNVPTLRRDLWAEIAMRLAEPEPRPKHRRPILVMRWAAAGVLALVLGLAIVRISIQPKQTDLARPEDEARVVKMMADLEPIRYVEADMAIGQDVQRALLTGETEP